MKKIVHDILTAFQFLTRLPLPHVAYQPHALSRAAAFFPLVGLAIGLVEAALYLCLTPHLPVALVALTMVAASILITGGLHEDGLADAADAFGGGRSKVQILAIMKDSRIGSYGAMALVLSIAARVLLIANMPTETLLSYVIAAEVLSRWTVLPISVALPSAHQEINPPSSPETHVANQKIHLPGQGARLAGHISIAALLLGTLLAFGPAVYLFRLSAWAPILACAFVALFTAIYYRWRIQGITGDCFGATIQTATIAVYLCGVWRA